MCVLFFWFRFPKALLPYIVSSGLKLYTNNQEIIRERVKRKHLGVVSVIKWAWEILEIIECTRWERKRKVMVNKNKMKNFYFLYPYKFIYNRRNSEFALPTTINGAQKLSTKRFKYPSSFVCLAWLENIEISVQTSRLWCRQITQ